MSNIAKGEGDMLGSLTLQVNGASVAKVGCLVGMAWLRGEGGRQSELSLIAHFSGKQVTVCVHVTPDHARRLGMAA